MPEGVLALTGHGAAPLAAHELAPLQLVETLLELEAVAAGDGRECARPEDLADDGGVLEQLLVRRVERVEAGGDDPVDRLGKLEFLRPALARHANELLRVERVSAGPLEQRRLYLRWTDRALEQGVHETCRIVVGERGERQRDRIRLAAAPGRPSREQLRSRGGNEEDGDVGEPVGQLVDEVEEAVVRPVQVLEHEHERTLLRERFEEPAPRRKCLVSPIGRTAGVAVAREPGERTHVRGDPARLRLVLQQASDRSAELLGSLRLGVRLEHAGLRLHHLADGPDANAFARGERAALAPGHEPLIALDRMEQLGEEPALADPGDADERHELWRSLAHRPLESGDEQLDLAVATDERRGRRAGDIDAETGACLERLPRRNRLRLSSRRHGLGAAVCNRAFRGSGRLLPDEDAVDRRRRLQPRGGVDDIAGGNPRSLVRPCVHGNQSLAGVDADADVQVRLVHSPVADRERRPHGSLRIVFVRHRRSEEGYDGIADELLHRPAEALELLANARVIVRQEGANVFGVEPFRLGRRADEIAEDGGDDLPLLPRRSLPGERGAAERAERKLAGQLALTARTRRHAPKGTTLLRRIPATRLRRP